MQTCTLTHTLYTHRTSRPHTHTYTQREGERPACAHTYTHTKRERARTGQKQEENAIMAAMMVCRLEGIEGKAQP